MVNKIFLLTHTSFIAVERDPKKRRVKPVQKEFLQLDFGGLDDSEDDSDFDVGKCGSGKNINLNLK